MREDVFEMTDSFQKGEEKGFTFFFKLHWEVLHYYAFRILNDKDTAKDVVEETYIKIWKRHVSFFHHQVIKSWLYTTVRNDCLNKLQKEKRKEEHHEIIAATQPRTDAPVIEKISLEELMAEMHVLINRLPAECKKVFTCLYIEGRTVRETSYKLKLSISTVKNQKGRGLDLIHKFLDGLKNKKPKPQTSDPPKIRNIKEEQAASKINWNKIERWADVFDWKQKAKVIPIKRNKKRALHEKVLEMRKTMKPNEIAKELHMKPKQITAMVCWLNKKAAIQ